MIKEFYDNLKRIDTPVRFVAGIRAVPKGRPRFSKGHAFTPAATREFEAQIRELGKKIMGHRLPYACPVLISVEILEKVPASRSAFEKELALAGMTVPLRGDLDNRVKAVTDALNGIVYYDDVQIADTIASKRYGSGDFITVKIERVGLSGLEIDRLKKLKKASHGSTDSRGSPQVG
jgi:Holliday junction resolvase RusA-like endonuclease